MNNLNNGEETASSVSPKPEYKIRYILHGQNHPIKSIKFSPNGKWLSTAAEEFVYIWDAHNGAFLKKLHGHTQNINDIAWSPNSFLFVSASNDKCLILRGFPSGKCLQTYQDDDKMFNSVSFDLLGTSIAAGTNDGKIFIWSNVTNLRFEGLYSQINVHNTWVASVDFLNYTNIITSSYDATCLKWNAAENTFSEPFSEPPDDPSITYAVVSPCQKYVLVSHLNQTYTSWEIDRNFYVNTYGHDDKSCYPVVGNFCYTGNRKLVLAGSLKECVYIWDFQSAEILQIIDQGEPVTAVASHPTENIIASSGANNRICLWKSDV